MIPTVHHCQCPLCGGRELKPYLSATDHLVSGEPFAIVRCCHCGFLFTQDAPSTEMMGKYYGSPDYRPHGSGEDMMSKVYRIACGMMMHRKRQLIEKHHPQQGLMIDVGAGTGEFLAYMRSHGWKVAGCEQSVAARAYALKHHGLLLDGDVMQATYDPASADVITAWHAIEHIHDLSGLWRCVHSWLKPDGMLVVAVPNVKSLDAECYGKDWAAWDVPRHLWHFSFKTMTMLAQNQGFRLVACRALPLDACYISLLSGKNKYQALAKGGGFALRSLFTHQKASSLIYVFAKQEVI